VTRRKGDEKPGKAFFEMEWTQEKGEKQPKRGPVSTGNLNPKNEKGEEKRNRGSRDKGGLVAFLREEKKQGRGAGTKEVKSRKPEE